MSLTLRQIVDMADKRVPNTETDDTKVTYLNQLQLQLFRKFKFPEEMEKIQTVKNQALYTLPSYIEPSRIVSIVVTDFDGSNPTLYTYKSNMDELTGNKYYFVRTESSNMIRIYETPDITGDLIMINYQQSANTLSSSDMTISPKFSKDYHMLFVYGLCRELAEINNDVTLANNYDTKYRELYKDALDGVNTLLPSKTLSIFGW